MKSVYSLKITVHLVNFELPDSVSHFQKFISLCILIQMRYITYGFKTPYVYFKPIKVGGKFIHLLYENRV